MPCTVSTSGVWREGNTSVTKRENMDSLWTKPIKVDEKPSFKGLCFDTKKLASTVYALVIPEFRGSDIYILFVCQWHCFGGYLSVILVFKLVSRRISSLAIAPKSV